MVVCRRIGDGEDIHAAIWVTDLRDSSELAASMSRDDYLSLLNRYFDSVAGAVLDHGGEVLKFIGDSVLAIFAISDRDEKNPEACARALAARLAKDQEYKSIGMLVGGIYASKPTQSIAQLPRDDSQVGQP